MRNSIILTNLREFFVTVRIVNIVKTGFVRQWNLQSFQSSSHVIIHMKSIQQPDHRMLFVVQMLERKKIPQSSTVFAIILKDLYSNSSTIYYLFAFLPRIINKNIWKACGESIITTESVIPLHADDYCLFVKVFP